MLAYLTPITFTPSSLAFCSNFWTLLGWQPNLFPSSHWTFTWAIGKIRSTSLKVISHALITSFKVIHIYFCNKSEHLWRSQLQNILASFIHNNTAHIHVLSRSTCEQNCSHIHSCLLITFKYFSAHMLTNLIVYCYVTQHLPLHLLFEDIAYIL